MIEDEDPKHFDRQMVKWTRVVGWFTALLFIANAIGLFFIEEQWRVANKSQVDTREQLRAAVGFQTINEQVFLDKDGKLVSIGFQPIFNNAGGTRTSKFLGWFSVRYFEKEIPNNIDLSKPYEKIETKNQLLPAGSISSFEMVSLGAEYVDKIVNQAGIGLIWGHADWADIFSPSDEHFIDFCFKLEPLTLQDGKKIVKPISYKQECNNSK